MSRFIIIIAIILALRLLFFYFLAPPAAEIISKNPLRETSIFSDIKGHIRQVFAQSLSAKNAGLLMGITFGEKDLDYADNQKFISTGVLHVVAASGMNVSMLTSFLLAILVTFLRRQYALVATAFIILFYTALADFQPSIVRAAIMAVIALGAQVVGRQNTALVALYFAASAMILWDPTIITSLSFILSFSATLGIILIDPILKYGYIKPSLFEDFRTTISAQIATTPILLFFFGTYSPISILTNLLILWTIPPLMVLGMAAALFAFVAPFASVVFIYLAMPLLTYFWVVVDWFSQRFTPFQLEGVPWALVVGYYLVVSSLIILLNRKAKTNV